MNIIIPEEGKHLKDKEGTIFEGKIYTPDYITEEYFTQVSEEEYQEFLQKEEDYENND